MSTKKLLIGLDGSEGSQRALDFGLTMAAAQGCPVQLMCVINYSAISFPVVEDLVTYEALRARESARLREEVMAPAQAKAKQLGIATETHVEFGSASEQLAQVAGEIDAQAIVIGRRGLSRIRALVFGSVASSLVQVAPVPVIVVP